MKFVHFWKSSFRPYDWDVFWQKPSFLCLSWSAICYTVDKSLLGIFVANACTKMHRRWFAVNIMGWFSSHSAKNAYTLRLHDYIIWLGLWWKLLIPVLICCLWHKLSFLVTCFGITAASSRPEHTYKMLDMIFKYISYVFYFGNNLTFFNVLMNDSGSSGSGCIKPFPNPITIQLKTHFLEWKYLNSDYNFNEVCS